jgi:hypothetical protein
MRLATWPGYPSARQGPTPKQPLRSFKSRLAKNRHPFQIPVHRIEWSAHPSARSCSCSLRPQSP